MQVLAKVIMLLCHSNSSVPWPFTHRDMLDWTHVLLYHAEMGPTFVYWRLSARSASQLELMLWDVNPNLLFASPHAVTWRNMEHLGIRAPHKGAIFVYHYDKIHNVLRGRILHTF